VPAAAQPKAAPQWKVVDKAGRFQWHDHRIHWMSTIPPKQVTDKSRRTKVFDWSVPMRVGSSTGAIRGTLFWQPTGGGGAPVAALAGLVALALAGLVAVVVVRRRRSAGSPVGSGVEAW
jgi:LPXTG-motif cell wall-anchored protein